MQIFPSPKNSIKWGPGVVPNLVEDGQKFCGLNLKQTILLYFYYQFEFVLRSKEYIKIYLSGTLLILTSNKTRMKKKIIFT